MTLFERIRFRLRMLRQGLTIAPIAGADGEGDGGEPSGQGEPSGEPAGSGDQPAPAATFTQADVDRIVQDRLARDRKSRPSDDELTALRQKAEQFDSLEEKNKTELQRAQERAAQLEKDAEKARRDARENFLRAAVVSEAAKRKVVDPDAAFALIDRSALEFDDSGSPTNIAAAMDSLKEQRPYLFGGNTPPGAADQGARGGKNQLTADQLESMSPEEIVQAQNEGRLDAALTGS